MSWFENSARVPLLFHYPKKFQAHHVSENVSTLDMMPTLVDLANTKIDPMLPEIDGNSLLPHLKGEKGGCDTVFGEYTGEATIRPMMMIRRGPWKYVVCPADPPQLFNLANDPRELTNLATSDDASVKKVFAAFEAEALAKWDFEKITKDVLVSQRKRQNVWNSLTKGRFESWDWNPNDDGRNKYIRSFLPLDDLELKARFPPVNAFGYERPKGQAGGVAAAKGE